MIETILNSEVFLTVVSGTLVFVAGQIIQLFILEKIYKYKEILGRIDNRLKFYFKIFENPGRAYERIDNRVQVASQELLQLSCDLDACRKQLIFRCRQKDKSVSQASNLLIDLHYDVFGESGGGNDGENLRKVERIRELLNIPILED